jgi:hypothetical protein
MGKLEERLALIETAQTQMSIAAENPDLSKGDLLALVALSAGLTLDARVSKLEAAAGLDLPELVIPEEDAS